MNTAVNNSVTYLEIDETAEGQRLGRTVQFSDSGLYPAQADHTRHLTRDTLGVPVVAAGILMVQLARLPAASPPARVPKPAVRDSGARD